MKFAALALILCLGGCTTWASRSSLHLTFANHVTCSGTAVGSHTLLGAQHCFKGTRLVRVNQHPVRVERIIRDHADHVLVTVNRYFPSYSLHADMPKIGSSIYIIGNPGDLVHMYRHGYVAGSAQLGSYHCTMLDLRIWSGDSGAGVRNRWGEVVGVISLIYTLNGPQGQLTMACAIPLKFTSDQWLQIR